MRQRKLLMLTVLSVLFNVLVGDLISTRLAVPLLYMDSVGTIFISIYGGLPWGLLAGVCSNLLKALWGGRVSSAYFAIVSAAIALTSYFMARKRFTLDKAIATGLALSLVSVLLSVPIRLFLLGGYTGSGTDTILNAMVALGSRLFSSAFFSSVASNVVDKILSCLLVWVVIRHMPSGFLGEENIK